MAEINIRRKKKPAWPWVILALIVLLAVAIWYWNESPAEKPTVNTTSYRQTYWQIDPLRTAVPNTASTMLAYQSVG